MADLEYRVENGVGTILLNRPEKRNAFTLEMLHQWAEVYREARTDDNVGAVVLTGAGDTFCAGGDLEGLAPGGRPRTTERPSSRTTSTASSTPSRTWTSP
jgi:enoyl-CoA hydratase/carnithine racemase